MPKPHASSKQGGWHECQNKWLPYLHHTCVATWWTLTYLQLNDCLFAPSCDACSYDHCNLISPCSCSMDCMMANLMHSISQTKYLVCTHNRMSTTAMHECKKGWIQAVNFKPKCGVCQKGVNDLNIKHIHANASMRLTINICTIPTVTMWYLRLG